eukprot:TRINITY_DN11988_c0_g3_i1.p1 TRINITY_DN11988_c0_g3~~TRINITY_DN11988_c0_g3_i1.p1  ORF type:complete len:217 (-),score=23.38 TRINITY_DN11988_c0_g3_i1:250-900(-)
MKDFPDHYATLGVSPESTAAEIKKSYYQLLLRLHPDKNLGREAEAERQFKSVTEAYQFLSDPVRRLQYDAQRAILRATQPTSPASEPASGSSATPATPQSPRPQSPQIPKATESALACPHRPRGCTWVGLRPQLAGHLVQCRHCPDWAVLMRVTLREESSRLRQQLSQTVRARDEISGFGSASARFCALGSVIGFVLGISVMLAMFAAYGKIPISR